MQNYTLPAYNVSQEPPARKVSYQNLQDLLAVLELALSTQVEGTIGTDLIAILTSMHSILSTQVGNNPSGTIAHYKLLSKYFLDLVRGLRGDQGDFSTRQWDFTHNVPSAFVELIQWYDTYMPKTGGPTSSSDFWFCLQVIFAFLNGHRVIVTPMRVNTSTITDPLSVPELPNWTEKFPLACKALGITPSEFQAIYKANCAKIKFPIITSGGPNGQATWSADLDAKAIIDEPGLFVAMNDFANASNLMTVITSLVGCVSTPLALNPGHRETVYTGRVHAIEEMGGKTRLVAILDYWTQVLLTPLHDTVAYFVRRLEQDGTFNQGKIVAKVRSWTGGDFSVNSFDLTAATDRIPIDIQVGLLTYLFGSDTLPNLWRKILVDRRYMDPNGHLIKYAVGQPMGAKSSFPMLALIHHVIIKIAALDAKVQGYTNYVVLGDDNTHANAAVAVSYRKVMASLGVGISDFKSVLHDPKLLTAAEICKRVFVSGFELSAFPVKALVKAVRFGHLASTVQTLLFERGSPISHNRLLEFFAGFIDRRSLQGLVMLNKVPLTVSGLPERLDVSAVKAVDYSSWFDGLLLTDAEIESAYTFALVSEQLKRVDGLLRSTMLMHETIKTMARPDPEKLWPVQLFESMNPEERATAISKLPQLNFTHPIVLASQSELDRVVSHLSALRSGSKAMQMKAREGLLDLLRNNLSEIWMGEAERANTVRRSIFNAMLGVLKRMSEVKTVEGKPRAVEFSLQLTYVQRSWSVYWELTQPVRLNAVKTRVSISSTMNRARLDTLFTDTPVRNLRI